MAFSKYAYANILVPDINIPIWDKVRDSAQALGSAFATRGASQIALGEFSPKEYLLTHATIVASVDTEKGPGPLGRHLENGFTIDRRFQDYYITPKTAAYINSNHDSWERKLLLASFRTYIGDSVYVDILVATHRKHKPLIAAINSKQLQTLSMGATVAHTQCTKCGNVAADETELCRCVKHEKGNKFLDILGMERKVAELCGHVSQPESNRFIEASWVGHPAFKGAVVRSILTAEEASAYDHLHSHRVQLAFSQPARSADPSLRQKAAKRAFDFGEEKEQFPGGDKEEEGSPPEEEKKKDPLDSVVNDLVKSLTDRAVRQIRQDLSGKDAPGNDVDENHTNNTLIPASDNRARRKLAHAVHRLTGDPRRTGMITRGILLQRQGGWRAIQASGEYSGRDVLAISRVLDLLQNAPGVAGEARIYRTVLAVGGASPYVDVETYLAACSGVLGRETTQSEKIALVTKGRLFDLGR
jgi:hypothetical protein